MIPILTEERHAMILETVRQQGSVKMTELCQMLDASESTVRRDLTVLDEKGLLRKVHGGAVTVQELFSAVEYNVEEKSRLFTEEKRQIAAYAASQIKEGDFIFIDAGTTTEMMIDYLPQRGVTCMTNGLVHARKLAQRGIPVYIPGGKFRIVTEAIIGEECVVALLHYNFTKCFIGTNGISVTGGFSTPESSEAMVKSTAIERSRQAFILSDHSKFDQLTAVTFAPLQAGTIITDRLPDERYQDYTQIKEVM